MGLPCAFMLQVNLHRWSRSFFTLACEVEVLGSPFQPRFVHQGAIVSRLSKQNDVIATPDCRKPTHLCHVNLLKPYYSHDMCSSPALLVEAGLDTLAQTVAESELQHIKDLDVPII